MMKVQKTNILDDEVVQIYISKSESKNDDIDKKINEIKQKNKNVVIFVSGKDDIASTLQYIINKQAVQII